MRLRAEPGSRNAYQCNPRRAWRGNPHRAWRGNGHFLRGDVRSDDSPEPLQKLSACLRRSVQPTEGALSFNISIGYEKPQRVASLTTRYLVKRTSVYMD